MHQKGSTVSVYQAIPSAKVSAHVCSVGDHGLMTVAGGGSASPDVRLPHRQRGVSEQDTGMTGHARAWRLLL